MSGLLDWLRGLLGDSGPDPAIRPSAAPAARPPAAPAPPPVAADAAPEAPADPPFAPFARALGIEEPAPPEPADPEAEAAIEALAAPVLEHFRKNRPGPASAPSLSLRILNLVAAPDADIAELSRLVSADPALTAGVLTVANSPNFRAVQEVETVREAIARLGFEEVARIAGAVSAKSLFSPRLKAELQTHGARFAALYHRALTVAGGAAWLAMQRRGGRSDRAYLGGMLHDVGKSVALRSVSALALSGGAGLAAGDPRLDVLLDRVHLEIGGEVHQEWALPEFATVICVRHHDRKIPAGDDWVDLHVVRLASALRLCHTRPLQASWLEEVGQSGRALGLDRFGLRSFDAEVRTFSQRASALARQGAPAPAGTAAAGLRPRR